MQSSGMSLDSKTKPTIWVRIKEEAPRKSQLVPLVQEAFGSLGYHVSFDFSPPSQSYPVDLAIGMGGDGSQLSTLRRLGERRYETPFLCFHLSAGLGFLPPYSVPQKDSDALVLFKEIALAFHSKNYKIENRWGLETGYQDQTLWALNDFVFSKGPLSRMIQLKVSVSGEVLLPKMRGDGLIISTSTGSTAYSLSAGGPVVDPNINVLILTPICPHEVSQRPLVLDGNHQVEVEVLESSSGGVFLTSDGQSQIEVGSNTKFVVKRSEKPVPWVIPKSTSVQARSFIEQLKHKLGYGGRI
jgi:NAD+ kinase